MVDIPCRKVGWALLSATLGAACATVDFQDTCVFKPNVRLSTFGYARLSIEVGLPEGVEPVDPAITLYSPSMEAATRQLRLPLVENKAQNLAKIDRASCKRIDWYRYSTTYDEDEWSKFWSRTDSERFTLFYSLTKRTARASPHSFALAIIDAETTEPIVYCGCYAL